ncbi:MAG: CHAT domain-containing tetratricopeptide repeat protein [Chryseolinea sp.]
MSLYSGMTVPLKIVLLLLALTPQLSATCQGSQNAQALYESGQAKILSDKEGAFDDFVLSMRIARREKQWQVYGLTVDQLGKLALEDHGNYDSAFRWTAEAIKILRPEVSDSLMAEIYCNGAKFYFRDFQVDLPLGYYYEAIKIYISKSGEWSDKIAKCYHGLGDVYKYNSFDYSNAEKNYERALEIRERIHSQDTLALYQNYYSLAATNRSQHDFEKALSYGTVALTLSGHLMEKHQEATHAIVANIYRDMGNSAMAKEHYLDALHLNKKTMNLNRRAWYYQSLGQTMAIDNLYNEAMKYYLMADALFSEATKKDQRLYTLLLVQMGYVYSLKGDEKNFYETITRVLRRLPKEKNVKSRVAAECYLLVGDHHERFNRHDSSLFYYQKSLRAAIPGFTSVKPGDNPSEEAIGFDYYVGQILAKKAAVMGKIFILSRKKEYSSQILECLELAESLLSKERNTLDTEDAKWTFLDKNYDLYEQIVGNLYDHSNAASRYQSIAQVFHYLEKSKSRSLADALALAEQSSRINTNDTLLQTHSFLKTEIFRAENSISDLLANNSNNENVDSLREEIAALDRKVQVCKAAIEKKYPGYFSVKYGNATPNLKSIRTLLKGRDQVILDYFWGSEWVYGLAINADTVLLARIGRPDSLKRQINSLLEHMEGEHSSTSREVFQSFVASASGLHDYLISPFSSMIKAAKRIQIIPDGFIAQIPFEILLEERPVGQTVDYRSLRYLLRSHSVGYAYSTSMMKQKSTRRVRNPSLLAIAFTGGKRLRAPQLDIDELEVIEGAEKEIEVLQKRFNEGKFLVEEQATESNFKSLSPDFDIIHLAVHGKGDIKTDFSGSLYFRSKYDSVDDGEFHSYELYGMKLKALMAVLSSCESGLGKGYKGEGMISMASAFTAAGCENTLMSLWKVNDQASTELMDNFYQYLLEGDEIDDALRRAKLNYLVAADELTADPKSWAPLVAYGSLNRIFKKDPSNLYLLIAGLIVGAIMLIAVLRNKKV